MITNFLTWKLVAEPPDSDTTVLLFDPAASEPVATEKKLRPSSVINQAAKARAVKQEEQQGFRPGRKQMKEIKEQVADDLLPRRQHPVCHPGMD